MKQIPLTQNKFAIVDDKDFEWLNQWKWYAWFSGRQWYARRSQHPQVYIHRFLFNLQSGDKQQIDHINGNGLDNRRCNSRICTNTQNCRNQRKRKNTSSKYKGVCWNKQWKKWMAYISPNNHFCFLGYFESEIEAEGIYDVAAKQYFGEFAKLNFGSNEK